METSLKSQLDSVCTLSKLTPKNLKALLASFNWDKVAKFLHSLFIENSWRWIFMLTLQHLRLYMIQNWSNLSQFSLPVSEYSTKGLSVIPILELTFHNGDINGPGSSYLLARGLQLHSQSAAQDSLIFEHKPGKMVTWLSVFLNWEGNEIL